MTDLSDDCASCGEDMPAGECPNSQRPCGHHCNHSWSHEECCWCGEKWEGEEEERPERQPQAPPPKREYMRDRAGNLSGLRRVPALGAE
jgi:hypothetical protein